MVDSDEERDPFFHSEESRGYASWKLRKKYMDTPLPIDHELDLMLPKIYKHMKGEAQSWENFFISDYVVKTIMGNNSILCCTIQSSFIAPSSTITI